MTTIPTLEPMSPPFFIDQQSRQHLSIMLSQSEQDNGDMPKLRPPSALKLKVYPAMTDQLVPVASLP
ncbi:unannotated protein [freshwater metagenome]|uniref:Unannotated protein n=1 Tax=freshwater metagenome TaxID=449393 RepID=A0A6J6UCU1_9ZZZZ